MIVLKLDGDKAWPEILGYKIHHVPSGFHMAALPDGTTGGHPSVAIRIDIGEQETVVAECTLKELLTAVDALKAKYGDPRFQ